jgi:ribosomal-protein-alanine N-acetyltransferase
MTTVAVTIRPSAAADVAAMAGIESAAFSDPWPMSSFRDLLVHPFSRMATATDAEGAVIGYCIMLQAADEAEIVNIATVPWRQRQGIGAQLLDDALAAAAVAGVVAMFLEVRESNRAARALYASRGFVAVGRRRSYYRNPVEDALVLRRDITASE